MSPFLETIANASAQAYGEIRGQSGGAAPPLFTFPVGTLFPFSTGGVGGTNGSTSNAGVTTGPTLSQVVATYSTITWPWITNTAYFNMRSYQGYQQFTVPVTGTYAIVCSGASGGYNPGSGGTTPGAIASGIFSLVQGQILTFVIGQMGGYSPYGGQAPPGGGGTFVFTSSGTFSTATALIVAGGGGGNAVNYGGSSSYGYGALGTAGNNSGDNSYSGGTNGGAFTGSTSGADGQGGAGISSSPISAVGGTLPLAISSGGTGGFLQYSSYGGFGGGGGFYGGGGGGGGFSGGAPGHWSAGATGGGGGSYISTGATASGIAQSGQALYNGAASIQRIS